MRGFQHVNVYCLPTKSATCLKMGLKVALGAGVEVKKGLVGEGQSIYSMGLLWREVRILAQRATTLSKGFLFFTLPLHMYKLFILQMFIGKFKH
jgi:hypothetical protein